MKKTITLFFISGLLLMAACSKKNTAGKSPAPVTYAADMNTLIQSKCAPCHLPSKGGRKTSLENFEAVKKYSADILRRVQLNPTDRGFMPFKNEKLNAGEIAVIKKWVDQGMAEK